MTQITSFTVIGDTDDGANFDITIPTLSSYLQSDNTATFAIYISAQTGGNWLAWRSSETGTSITAPLLSYTTLPEPSTLALGAIGLLVLNGYRRRRKP